MNSHAVRLRIHLPRTVRVFFPADGTLWPQVVPTTVIRAARDRAAEFAHRVYR
jgi:hypothetical protein